MYYLRSQAASAAIKFTLDKSSLDQKVEKVNEVELAKTQKQDAITCSLDDPEGCEMCGS